MNVINVNYRGSLQVPINLYLLHNVFPNSKLLHHPFQLVIKDQQGTLVLFSNGKYRLMGFKSQDDLEATALVYKYTSVIHMEYIPLLTLQSMTMKVKFNHNIDLYKLSSMIKSILELELFPALTITKYKPVTVNVFSTGTIIMCGIKDVDFSNTIFNELKELLHVCIMQT